MKFKDLFEGSGAPAADQVTKKDDDKEATGYKPRSKGEEDFAKKHVADKKNHPAATEDQFASSKGQSDDHKGGKKHADGDTAPLKQGSSEVEAKGTAFRSMKQYGRPGEKTPVSQGSSKLKEENELHEGVIETLKKIKDRKQAMPIKLKNGKSLKVDSYTASALLSVYDALKPANAKKFATNLEKGESTFMSMVDFAMQSL